MVAIKRIIKRAIQTGVAVCAPKLVRWPRPRLLILMYHRVLPAGHAARAREQPGMYVSPETLELHLDVLRRSFNFIHLDEWLERMRKGLTVPSHACAITFDDGWRDNYEYAYPVLRRASVPATIYLVSDLVGTRYSFWPNVVANALAAAGERSSRRWPELLYETLESTRGSREVPNSGFDPTIIDEVIVALKRSRTDAEMRLIAQQLLDGTAGSSRDLMSWDEAREMASDGFIRFGSHTLTHTRLSKEIGIEQLRREIVDSTSVIEQHLGVRPRTFCYPNGDYDDAVLDLVRPAYEGAVTTRRGWNTRASDVHLLRRVGVHDDVSRDEISFLSRIHGVG